MLLSAVHQAGGQAGRSLLGAGHLLAALQYLDQHLKGGPAVGIMPEAAPDQPDPLRGQVGESLLELLLQRLAARHKQCVKLQQQQQQQQQQQE